MSAKSNIVLIGMPGAGKSTLGVVLAKMLNRKFLDTDLLIQTQCGATLQALIDEHGPRGFIETENEILGSINAEGTVIATGGSAVYSAPAMSHLAETGIIVYLQISYDSLVERLGDLAERGVVMTGTARTLRDLYDERRPLYEHFADATVDIDRLSIADAARKVSEECDREVASLSRLFPRM